MADMRDRPAYVSRIVDMLTPDQVQRLLKASYQRELAQDLGMDVELIVEPKLVVRGRQELVQELEKAGRQAGADIAPDWIFGEYAGLIYIQKG